MWMHLIRSMVVIPPHKTKLYLGGKSIGQRKCLRICRILWHAAWAYHIVMHVMMLWYGSSAVVQK